VIPVNPFAETVLGEPAYDDLEAVDPAVDLVNVFRPSDEVPTILTTVCDRGDVETAWLQLGIRHDEAAAEAEADGIDVVQDRCMKVEHGRLIG
jgi:predicted CoA-binding protein